MRAICIAIFTVSYVVLGVHSPSFAQNATGANGKRIALPTSPASWLNSGPLSVEGLKGKGIVFYYYEEGCPRCREKWPGILRAAKSMRDEPVIFVAVNSGNSPAKVAKYLQQNGIDWPTIVDTNRSFERATLGQEISLRNIYAARMLTAAGEWRGAPASDMAAAGKAAAAGGSWRVDPDIVPAELKTAWRGIEIGNFSLASRAIAKASRSENEATKTAAEAMLKAANDSMEAEIAEVNKLQEEGDDWRAFQVLQSIVARFDGYPFETDLSEQLAELRESEQVDNQYRAAKRLAAAIRTGSVGTPSAVRRAAVVLKQIVADYPGTEGADEAQSILDKLAAQGIGQPN